MTVTTDLNASVIDGVLVPAAPREQARQERHVRARFFRTLRRALAHLPFANDVVAAYHCALDPATPAAPKGILLAALAYFVMPIDIVPDFLVGIGFTDDVAVLLAAFQAVRHHIRPEHYEKARRNIDALSENA